MSTENLDELEARKAVGLTAEQAFNLRLDAIVASQADLSDRLTAVFELVKKLGNDIVEWREQQARELRELKRKQRELERRIEDLEEGTGT